jgi:hypothetical protein
MQRDFLMAFVRTGSPNQEWQCTMDLSPNATKAFWERCF